MSGVRSYDEAEGSSGCSWEGAPEFSPLGWESASRESTLAQLLASAEAAFSRHGSVRHGLAGYGLRDTQGHGSSSGLKHPISPDWLSRLCWWLINRIKKAFLRRTGVGQRDKIGHLYKVRRTVVGTEWPLPHGSGPELGQGGRYPWPSVISGAQGGGVAQIRMFCTPQMWYSLESRNAQLCPPEPLSFSWFSNLQVHWNSFGLIMGSPVQPTMSGSVTTSWF